MLTLKPTPTPTPRPIPTSNPTPTPTPAPSPTPNVLATARANLCDVTKPATNPPPGVNTDTYNPWYRAANGRLWLAPANLKVADGLAAPANAFWIQGNQTIVVLSAKSPQITGHLLSDPSITVNTSSERAISFSYPSTIPASLQPPRTIQLFLSEPGCWQITAISGVDALTITTWVIPASQVSPANTSANPQPTNPYPVPVACPVTSWHQPQPGENYGISGEGLTLWVNSPVLFAGHASAAYLANNPTAQPNFTGVLLGNTAANMTASWVLNEGPTGQEAWYGEVTFSTPGCWHVVLASKSESVDTTLSIQCDHLCLSGRLLSRGGRRGAGNLPHAVAGVSRGTPYAPTPPS